MRTHSQRADTKSFGPDSQTILFYTLSILAALSIEFLLGHVARSNKNWLGEIAQLGMCLFGVLSLISINLFGSSLRRKEQEKAQRKRDDHANSLYEELLSDSSTTLQEHLRDTYFLYLRPFTSTGCAKIVLKSGMVKRASANITPYNYPDFGQTTVYRRDVTWGDLETQLSIALAPTAPLIGLGKPGEQIGAGRVLSSDETWRPAFFRLAEGARLIFLFLSTHEGTKWEVAQLVKNHSLLRKCIFIVPPDNSLFGAPKTLGPDFSFGSKPTISNDDEFRIDALRALSYLKLNRDGIEHIENNHHGMMFRLRKDRSILADKQLLVYRNAFPSFIYTHVKKLSMTDLMQAIHELEMYYHRVDPEYRGRYIVAATSGTEGNTHLRSDH